MITPEQLKAILPTCKDPDTWSFELSAVLPNHDITTKERIASFLSQTGHESADYNILVENLNYSAQALRREFPKYFPDNQFGLLQEFMLTVWVMVVKNHKKAGNTVGVA